jgi:dynein heavy chain
LNDEWEKLDADEVESTVETSNKTLAQVIRFFRDKDLPGILKIAEIVKAEVDEFKPYVDVVLALRKEGMKERHWTAISEKVLFDVKPVEGFTFTTVMDLGLLNFVEDCTDIGDRAAKEYNIECQMTKMKTDWESVEYKLVAFKKSGTFSVAGFDDAMALLDEHIVLTQAMQFSPFKKPFEEEIEEWNSSLLYVSDCIDEWIKCQG